MGLLNLLIHGFIGHNFRLMLLLLENRILHGVSFVEDGDFSLGYQTVANDVMSLLLNLAQYTSSPMPETFCHSWVFYTYTTIILFV